MFQALGQWGQSKNLAGDKQGLVEKKDRLALSFPLPDPTCHPPAFLIVPTNQEQGTGDAKCHCCYSGYSILGYK